MEAQGLYGSTGSVWKHRIGVEGGLGILVRRGIQFSELNLTLHPNGQFEVLAINLVRERDMAT